MLYLLPPACASQLLWPIAERRCRTLDPGLEVLLKMRTIASGFNFLHQVCLVCVQYSN